MSRPNSVEAEKLARCTARALGGEYTVDGVRRLSGGASRETWAFDVAGPDGAFGNELNRLILLGRDGFRQALGPATKTVVAQQLISALRARLAAPAR